MDTTEVEQQLERLYRGCPAAFPMSDSSVRVAEVDGKVLARWRNAKGRGDTHAEALGALVEDATGLLFGAIDAWNRAARQARQDEENAREIAALLETQVGRARALARSVVKRAA